MKIRVFYLLSLVLIFTFSSAVFVSQYYEAYAVFENNMSISEPIDYKHADSLVRCAMSCSLGCQTFNYNHNAGLCLTYNTCHALNMTVSEMERHNSPSYSKYCKFENKGT